MLVFLKASAARRAEAEGGKEAPTDRKQ